MWSISTQRNKTICLKLAVGANSCPTLSRYITHVDKVDSNMLIAVSFSYNSLIIICVPLCLMFNKINKQNTLTNVGPT